VLAWPVGRSGATHGLDGQPAIEWQPANWSPSPIITATDDRATRVDASPGTDVICAGVSWLWQLLGQGQTGREHWSELLRLAITSAERPVRAECLNIIGQFVEAAGDLGMAHGCFQEALLAGRASQNAESVVRSLDGLTGIAAARGAFELARTLQDEALAIRRRLGDRAGLARSLAILGWLTLEQRGAEHADAILEESLTVRVSLGLLMGQAYSLVHLGWLAFLDGNPQMARGHLLEALSTVHGLPDRWKIVSVLALLGQPGASESPARAAAQLLIRAELLEAAAEIDRAAVADPFGYLQAARARLTPRALAVALRGGQGVDAEGLVDGALCASDARASQHGNGITPRLERQLLTPRELEVAALIGKGHTNRRVADELIIAERTAETHARNIREKLGLTTRSQIAAWAAVRAATRPEQPNDQMGTRASG